MPRSNVPSRSRASSPCGHASPSWRLVGITAAGCSDSGPLQLALRRQPAPAEPAQQEVTGSIAPARADHRVGRSRCRRSAVRRRSPPHSGTPLRRAGFRRLSPGLARRRHRLGRAQPTGRWTWDGGSPVTVGQGETPSTPSPASTACRRPPSCRPTASPTRAGDPPGPAPGHPALRVTAPPSRRTAAAPSLSCSVVAPQSAAGAARPTTSISCSRARA